MSNAFSIRPVRALMLGVFLGGLLAAGTALASGGHANDLRDSSPPPPVPPQGQTHTETDDLTTCPKGKMWDAKRKACVAMRGDALPDDAVADYAYALAKAGRFDEALETLDLMKDANTAEALNYRGYATRKLGRVEEAVGYYLRSVALEPRYAKVREYLGEAYLIQGRRDLAEQQLDTIETICGAGCEPYRDLSSAIAGTPEL